MDEAQASAAAVAAAGAGVGVGAGVGAAADAASAVEVTRAAAEGGATSASTSTSTSTNASTSSNASSNAEHAAATAAPVPTKAAPASAAPTKAAAPTATPVASATATTTASASANRAKSHQPTTSAPTPAPAAGAATPTTTTSAPGRFLSSLRGIFSTSSSTSPSPASTSSSSSSSSSSPSSSLSPSVSPPPPSSTSASPSTPSFALSTFTSSLLSTLGNLTTPSFGGGGGGGNSGGNSGGGGANSPTEVDRLRKNLDELKSQWLALMASVSITNGATIAAKTRKLAWHGIPPAVRPDAWMFIIRNDLHMTEDLFLILRGRAQQVKETRALLRAEQLRAEQARREEEAAAAAAATASSSSSTSVASPSPADAVNKEHSIELIERDIERTFPDLKFFHGDGPLADPLLTILETYACYRPDMGYVQGMSYIAAMLLLNMDTYSAFVGFANLLNQDMYFKFYRMNSTEMQLHLRAFQVVFKDNLPALYAHFERIDVRPDMFLYDWLLTIFTRLLPLDVTHRVWDNFLCHGHVFLFRTALGVLRMDQATLQRTSFEEALAVLQNTRAHVSEEVLFEAIGKIACTEERLARILHDLQQQQA